MEVVAIAVIVGFASYMLVKQNKVFDVRPKINQKNKLPSKMSDSEYLKKVMAETEAKDQAGKMRAENRERIKKDFLHK